MIFVEYLKIIEQSAATVGYDHFLPSMCIVEGDSDSLEVLQTELDPKGEEAIAKNWASQFTQTGQVMFLAYRSGSGSVTVIEITGTEVTKKEWMQILPFDSHSGDTGSIAQ